MEEMKENLDKEVQRRHAEGESYEVIANSLCLDLVVVKFLGDAEVYDAVERARNSPAYLRKRRSVS